MEWQDTEHNDLTQNFPLSGYGHKRYYGFYRAKVISNEEKKNKYGLLEKTGKIEVFIPTLMFDMKDDTKGIYAYPSMFFYAQNQDMMQNDANTGDKHREDYGSFLVPPKGSFVYVFFEDGDPNCPRYLPFSPTQILGTPLYEPMNKLHPEKEFYLLKTPKGHRLFISDNNDRIVARTYKNFMLEIREEFKEPKPKDGEFNPLPGKYILLWAPEEDPSKPFGSDAGQIGHGNMDPDVQNKDNPDCKGGQIASVYCKGGNGVRGSTRTIIDEYQVPKEYKKQRDPYLIRDVRKKYLGIDDPGIKATKEIKQSGRPVKGYRAELCSHEEKQYIQLETSKKYILYLNQHNEDQFIKLQTEKKYRFEMHQRDDEQFIQLEMPQDYHFYMNAHPDDRFIRAQTSTKFRFEMNEKYINRWIQLETAKHNFFEMNDRYKYILVRTSDNHLIRMDDKNRYILIRTRNGNLIYLDDKKETITIKANQTIILEAPEVIINSNYATVNADSVFVNSPDINLGGRSGARVITEKSICPFTGQPHTDGATTTKAM